MQVFFKVSRTHSIITNRNKRLLPGPYCSQLIKFITTGFPLMCAVVLNL